MPPKQRCFLLFKKLDLNTRAVAKVGSAIWYLSEGCDVNVSVEVPDLPTALRTLMRERSILRQALEAELKAMWAESAAKAAINS
jgi:hypothetical protein